MRFATLRPAPLLSAVALCLLSAAPALAQTATTTPAKKELIARILELRRPAIEGAGVGLVAQTVGQLERQVGPFIQQRVAPEKRETLVREIEADVRKFIEEATPVAREQAVKLAPSTIGASLDERMDEAELRQLIAALESPAFRKFEQVMGETQRNFLPKLLAELRPALQPKERALAQAVDKRLGLNQPAPASTPKK